VATQGLLKSAISVVSNEVKDHFTKGIKEGLSDYIAKDLLDIDNKGNDEQRKKDIKLASDLSAGVSIDMVIGGAYSIVKGSKNAVKADERLKENNVNSNAIVKSNVSKKIDNIPKEFKETKEFGYNHGQKIYKYNGKYYSKDIDSHNGGEWKVFEKVGNRLKRIGTADKDLNIFKR